MWYVTEVDIEQTDHLVGASRLRCENNDHRCTA